MSACNEKGLRVQMKKNRVKILRGWQLAFAMTLLIPKASRNIDKGKSPTPSERETYVTTGLQVQQGQNKTRVVQLAPEKH